MKVSFEVSGRPAAPVEQRSASIESPTVAVSSANFMAYFGMQSVNLPRVTIERALTVPAVWAAVAFLSRTMATLPLHAFVERDGSAERVTGGIEDVIHGAWTPEDGGYKARVYFWQQVFTGGRGLAWVERKGGEVENIWPMVPNKVAIKRIGSRRSYRYDGRELDAADVIDLPFMLKADQLSHFGPIAQGAKAIQLALAMNDYGANFFAGGGVPPLSLSGALPEGGAALKRAVADVEAAIKFARDNDSPIMPIPAGHKLEPVGIDPAKGQMTEGRLFQIQEIARVYQIPPAFLQDLSRGTFANVEQQDLHLVKHLIGQWAEAAEDEFNLKLFGRKAQGRFVEHNLDGLMRGDFKSRVDALARGIQTGQITPNEARRLDNKPKHKNPMADELLVQGATVVLGQQPVLPAPVEPKKDGEGDEPKA